MIKRRSRDDDGGRYTGTDPQFGSPESEFQFNYPLTQFDYDVAKLAWEKGLSSNRILDHFNIAKTAQNITRVRRALEKAVRHGLVVLNPLLNEQLTIQLTQAFPSAGQIDVEIDRTAVCLKAARIMAEEIEKFLDDKTREEMVIANAGGRTIRDCIDCLQRLVPVPPEINNTKKLTFLSLNAAEIHDRYDECANFLSVRMAQIYNVRHFAAVRSGGNQIRKEYHQKLDRIDLLISSAGALSNPDAGSDNLTGAGVLAHWFHSMNQKIPAEAVGEIAFHLIDRKGHQVQLSQKIKNMIKRELQPAPAWDILNLLFRKKKVLLVLTDNKVEVGYAVLDSALSQRCILDSPLVKPLLERGKDHAP